MHLNRKAAAIALCAAVLLELGVLAVVYWRYRDEILDVDGLTSALVARTLFEGQGYRTPVLSLFETNVYFREGRLAEGPPWPNANRFPLPVLTRQVYFALFGVNWFTGYYLDSLLFHFLAACALWLLTISVSRDPLAAALAVLLYVAHPHLITTAVRGTNYSLETFLYLILAVALVRGLRAQETTFRWMFVAGVVTGLGVLNRYSSGALWLMAVLVGVAIGARRDSRGALKASLGVLLGALLVVSPFAVWGWKTFGRPFYSNQLGLQLAHLTGVARGMNPWWQLEYAVDPRSLREIALADPWGLVLKTLGFLGDLAVKLPTLHGQPWLWVFIGLGLGRGSGLDPGGRAAVWVLVRLTVVVAGLQVALLPPLGGGINYFWYLFVVPYLVGAVGLSAGLRAVADFSGAGRAHEQGASLTNILWVGVGLLGAWVSVGLWAIRREMPLAQILALGVVCAGGAAGLSVVSRMGWGRPAEAPLRVAVGASLLAAPLLYLSVGSHFVGEWSRARTINRDWKTEWNAEWLRRVADRAPPGVFLALSPWKVAWVTGRAVLPLPNDPAEVNALIEKYKLQIAGVLLEPLTPEFVRDTFAPPLMWGYEAFRNRALTLPGFRLVASDVGWSVRTFGIRSSEGGDRDAEKRSEVLLYPLYGLDRPSEWQERIAGIDHPRRWIEGSRVRRHEVVESGGKRTVLVDEELSFYLEAPVECELAIAFQGGQGEVSGVVLTLNANRLRLGEPGRSLGAFVVGDREELRLRLAPEWLAAGVNRIGIGIAWRRWGGAGIGPAGAALSSGVAWQRGDAGGAREALRGAIRAITLRRVSG